MQGKTDETLEKCKINIVVALLAKTKQKWDEKRLVKMTTYKLWPQPQAKNNSNVYLKSKNNLRLRITTNVHLKPQGRHQDFNLT